MTEPVTSLINDRTQTDRKAGRAYLAITGESMQSCSRSLAGLALSFASVAAWAQSAPTVGFLYNTQENHSLAYRCESVRTGHLECEFVQTAVRRKSTKEDLPSILEKTRKEFVAEKLSVEDCKTYRDVLAVFEGKKTAPTPKAIAAMSQVEKTDGLRIGKALVEYCDRPSIESYLEIVRIGHDKDCRTCLVSSKPFKQSFRMLSDGSGRVVWITQGPPEGVCGVVQLSRFESEETKIGKSTFTNWSYIARKAITNPSADFLPGAKCSALDERPYTYDWRSKDHQMTCDYIQFSPL